ncbi:MAG: polysaccharide biosynthesis tyrosine autokinase [Verrucomicrobia bacterium]|nr:polysaccharide biosynthesis tyrosine autokinase [Verrucomicrobiota bacterium]
MQNYGYPNPYGAPAEPYEEDLSGGALQKIDLRYYWYVLLERRWMVIITFTLVMAAAGVYLTKAPRIYRATAQIQIDPEEEASLQGQRGGGGLVTMDEQYLQTQYKKLTSRTLIQAVIRRERLDQDPRYAKHRDLVEAVLDDIKISPVRMTRLVNISVEHPNPRKAAQIANALAEEFIKQNASQRQKKSLDMLFLLKSQAAELQRDVTQKEEALQRFREQKSFASFEDNFNIIAQALSAAQAKYADARAKSKTMGTTLKEIEDYMKSGKDLAAFPLIANDPEVSGLRLQLAQLGNDLAALLKRYKDKHPKVIEARSKIQAVKDSIKKIAGEKLVSMRAEAQLAQAQERELADNVNYWEQRLMEWNKAKAQYDVLHRQAETSQQLYTIVLSKLKEVDLMTRNKANNILVIDPATPPPTYVKPNLAITLSAGTFGGLVLALGLALFVSYLDDSIKTQDDVELHLKLPFLGYVPDIKGIKEDDRRLIAHTQPRHSASEAFRSIRAGIVLGGRGERIRVLTVTSTIPGEGKSLVAANLAIAIAQTGQKTLLVDGDLRQPSLHRTFKFHGKAGLASYLSGESESLEEIVHHSEVPNLDIIFCGSPPAQPSELLGSRRMMEFMQEVSSRYDRVIIDSPPVSAVSDPLLIAAMADGVVYVIKFNRVRRDHAGKCIRKLQETGAYICGAILNDIDFEGRDAYYYHGYYYYYRNRYYGSYGRQGGSRSGRADQEAAQEGREAEAKNA